MKREYKMFIIGCLTIGLFDALGSIASRQFNFNYGFLSPIVFFIYGTFGFIGATNKSVKSGVLLATAIGLFDSTIGWEISMVLNANTGKLAYHPTIIVWIITIIFVTGLAALCGLAGAWLKKIIKRKAMNSNPNSTKNV